jgi:isochorismate synthase
MMQTTPHGKRSRAATHATDLHRAGIPFCLCRFPGKDHPELFIVNRGNPKSSTFIVKNWKGNQTLQMRNFDPSQGQLDAAGNEGGAASFLAKAGLPAHTNFDTYAAQFHAMQAAFSEKGIRKAILSRVKQVPLPVGFDPLTFFENLERSYPSAFVYLLAHQDLGVWLGASPEVLMLGDKNHWLTHSLAGTQSVLTTGNYQWSPKEWEEQALVSEHIRNTLREAGIQNWTEEGPLTTEAGSVAHLLTRIKFNHPLAAEALLNRLHPTPAVAGLPVLEALTLIDEIEAHDRGLYAGYLGKVHFPEGAALFVNLRCMQVGADALALYVGGGLTAQSQVQREWEETDHKALTLEKLLHG